MMIVDVVIVYRTSNETLLYNHHQHHHHHQHQAKAVRVVVESIQNTHNKVGWS